ncbi:YD repeat-containing protein [Hydrogenispora ethanolica]|jgi:YD repeat-containing protein|uniref:YD repeat-containing protein n=1 Tax=Hydrogenispora ethanolica TaxID=1082276 RepID=A0A4R1QUJ4_HYDET|nr:RHS repeat domain-containing protein [Hydrogenispora ethanolica]TCL53820.1 YD repeat-containing protein [Hydrogenispora ethanolica]
MIATKDANSNILYFDYSWKYNYAYLTRIYKQDGTTIASYSYDMDANQQSGFDNGKPIQATDPKGNSFLYSYDGIGRLTTETLDNPDPKVGFTRSVTYDDANSIISFQFGNDTAGWQYGKVLYDPIFGEFRRIQRQLDGNWVTLKELAYDSNGNGVMGNEKENLVCHNSDYYIVRSAGIRR